MRASSSTTELTHGSDSLSVTGIRPCIRPLGFVIADAKRNILSWERNLESAVMAFRDLPTAYTITRCADYELMAHQFIRGVRGPTKPMYEALARENRPSHDDVLEYSEAMRAQIRSDLDTLPPPPAEGEDVDVSDEADTLRSIKAGIAVLETEWEREDALDVCISPASRMPPVEIVDDEDFE